MADDMDEIEDLLEAPYKDIPTNTIAPLQEKKEEVNGVSNGEKMTNGVGANGTENHAPGKDVEMVDKSSSDKDKLKDNKKSHRDRSRSKEHSGKHKKRSRSSSRSKKSKRSSRSRDRGEKDKKDKVKEREKSRDRKRRSRSRRRSRSKSDDRDRKRRSRSRSSERRRRSRSARRRRTRSRDDSRRRRERRSPRARTPPKREKSPELTPEERDVRTVFCMQLSNRIRPRDLEDFFSSVGPVRDCRLITDPRTKRSKGIAYIEFRNVESVALSIGLTGQRLLGVPIMVKPSQAEKNRMPLVIPSQGTAIIPQTGPMKLYIGSLHVNINEEMLRGIFEPFGTIDAIVLCKDDFGRSKGYGFIQFANADDAKRAMEQLNNFELANRPIKVAPFIEKPLDGSGAIANLDNDELDRSGVNLGPSGKLALMAKLAEGSGIKLPQHTIDALNMATAASTAANNSSVPPTSQCLLLTNMFDLAEESSKSNWVNDIRDDVIEECTKYGGIVHIYIDQKDQNGNIYIKCPSIGIAMAAMAALNGRYFAGKQITADFIQVSNYHTIFPDSVNCVQILKPSS